jgi:phosphohistidine phosphatase
MNLFLVRHGIAEDQPPDGQGGDAARPLSERGVTRTRAAAEGFAAAFGPVDAVVASPLLRARQTADLFAAALKLKARPGVARELEPGARAADTVAWLGRRTEGALVLVGHMPNLELLASLLLAGHEGLLAFEFRKAGLCALAFEGTVAPGKARLRAFLPPGALRKMGSDRD